jgi:penicillin-binding protein 2
LVLVFGVFVSRLFILQVVQNEEWNAKAIENSTEEINVASLRGIIYDRNGVVLAQNIASYNVAITAANLPDDDGSTQEIFRQLSKLIGVPVNRGEISPDNPFVPCISDHGIAQIAEYGESSTPFQPVEVKCDVDRQMRWSSAEKSPIARRKHRNPVVREYQLALCQPPGWFFASTKWLSKILHRKGSIEPG